MLKKLTFILPILIAVLLASCDGEKGDVGPAGPAGPAGAQGPKGDSGVNGQDGEDGVGALMISSGPVKSYQGGYVLGKSGLTATDSVFLSNCAVLTYVRAQDRYYAVPGVVKWEGNTKHTNFNSWSTYLNTRFYVVIDPISWSEDQATPPEREFQDVRAILVPAEKFRLNADADWSDYEATVKSLGADVKILTADK